MSLRAVWKTVCSICAGLLGVRTCGESEGKTWGRDHCQAPPLSPSTPCMSGELCVVLDGLPISAVVMEAHQCPK
jgi:hypothetical protein